MAANQPPTMEGRATRSRYHPPCTPETGVPLSLSPPGAVLPSPRGEYLPAGSEVIASSSPLSCEGVSHKSKPSEPADRAMSVAQLAQGR